MNTATLGASAPVRSNVIAFFPVGKPRRQPPHFSILDAADVGAPIDAGQLETLKTAVREAVTHLKQTPHVHRAIHRHVARQFGAKSLDGLRREDFELALELIRVMRNRFVAWEVSLCNMERQFLLNLLARLDRESGHE